PARAPEALAALPAGAVVHVVDISADSDGAPKLARDDGALLASTAARWGGLAVDATGGDRITPLADFAAPARMLAQPVSIDHVVIRLGGAGTSDDELGELAEGTGVVTTWRARGQDPVVVEGEIWSRTWRRVLTSDTASSRRWAGEVIGDAV